MKYLIAFPFLCGVVSAHAATYQFTDIELVSLEVTIPGMPTLTTEVELSPWQDIIGGFSYFLNGSPVPVQAGVSHPYMQINLDNGLGKSAVYTVPRLTASSNSNLSTVAYDPVTRTLTGSMPFGSANAGAAFCTGDIYICSSLSYNGVAFPSFTTDLQLMMVLSENLYYGEGTLSVFTQSPYGVTFTSTYAVNAIHLDPVPLPAAGWLFGTLMLGLGGTTLRRNNWFA